MGLAPARRARGHTAAAGFTLIELMVVVALIAISTALVTLALRDGRGVRLEREAERLTVLLEAARAESRISGLPVWWVPAPPSEPPGFRFVGLPETLARAAGLSNGWLDPEMRAEIVGANQITLGPEAVIGPQRIVLQLEDRRLAIGSDGLAPFAVLDADEQAAPS
ncbi:MAG: prepilin-type N-terminal cleavage/methylation domain-containing protein [Rubrivivax sp.]